MHGPDSLLAACPTRDAALRLLADLADRVPVSVAIYGAGAGLPLLFRNRRMAARRHAAPADLDHPSLRAAAVRVLSHGRPERLELDLAGGYGTGARRRWTLSAVRAGDSGTVALLAVVEELDQPVLARRRMESAIDHGMHLLLEVARFAEEHPGMDDFLAAVSDRVALLVEADGVAFNTYDRDRRALLPCRGAGVETPALPCDPAAADLLSQVVFAGRVYTGTLDFQHLELRPYAHLTRTWLDTGTSVMIVPWRAGNERLGALVANGARRPGGFTEEDAIVLIAAGHAAGLVWQRKRAEQRLEGRAEELESLEQAKSRFLMLASHELRTPLTLLNGYVSLLADGSQPAERVGEVVPVLQDALSRLNGLVDQLMDATRLSDPQFQLERRTVDLPAAVERTARQVAARWRREADLEVRLPETGVDAHVDDARVETAVAGLVDNAFKYSEPGAPVRCDLRLEPGRVRLLVSDRGSGMTEADLRNLFTRFGRGRGAEDRATWGTGLSLFLGREIARLHGGDLTAVSVAGRGSTFELTLPLDAAQADRRTGAR